MRFFIYIYIFLFLFFKNCHPTTKFEELLNLNLSQIHLPPNQNFQIANSINFTTSIIFFGNNNTICFDFDIGNMFKQGMIFLILNPVSIAFVNITFTPLSDKHLNRYKYVPHTLFNFFNKITNNFSSYSISLEV